MTMTLDIPPQLLEQARRLTQATTDEQAVVRSVQLLVGQHSSDKFDFDNGNPDDITPIRNASGQYMTRAEFHAKRRRQADLIPLLGTFESLVCDEEFRTMRKMHLPHTDTMVTL